MNLTVYRRDEVAERERERERENFIYHKINANADANVFDKQLSRAQ